MTDTVFIPIAAGEKIPTVKGWSKASYEDSLSWWVDTPLDANTAMRLDGLVMVDADSGELTDWFIDFIVAKGLPDPIRVITPRGAHFYWRLPEGAEHPPSFSLDAPYEGDIRVKSGPGQYALVPPSRTVHGSYEWASQERPAGAPLAGASVVRVLGDQKRDPVAHTATEGSISGLIQPGMRNTALTGFAGLMRRYGFDDDATMRVLNGLNHQLTENPLPDEEVMAIVHSSNRWEQAVFPNGIEIAEEEGELEVGNIPEGIFSMLSSMTLPPPAEWYFDPYIPAGRLVLLDGLEGIGKGMFCAWLATRMTGVHESPVIWAAAEDDPEEDIQKRMKAAGWNAATHQEVFFFNEWPKFPHHIKPVAKLIETTGAKLVIMDPGRSFISREDGAPMSYNDEAAIRPAMQELNRMARQTGATVLFVHHWNKDGQGSTRSRASGTGAFAQVVRHRLSMGSAGKGEFTEWAIEVNKSNITQAGHLHGFKLTADKGLDTAYFEWTEPLKGQDLGGWLKDRAGTLEGSIQLDPVDQLRSILTESLAPGQHLPKRGELTALAGMSEHKVRDALASLRDEGLIFAEPGKPIIWNGS